MTTRPVALVTGASSGIGLELCRLLAADGLDLVLVARGEPALRALAAELHGAHGIAAHVLPADLARPDAPAEIQAACAALGLEIDLLVNNAGFGSNGAFSELDLAGELAMIQVNVAALVALTGQFLPGMVARKRGRVLNIASTAGFQPGPYMATYYATKAFVLSWSEAIAIELKGSGVTVTCHCPGATESAFAAAAGNDKTRLFQDQKPASAADVAAHAWRATKAGQRVAIHGLLNAVGASTVGFVPRAWAAAIAARLNRP